MSGLVENFDSYDNSVTTNLGTSPGNLTGDVWVGVINPTGAAQIVDKSSSDQAARIYGVNNGWRGMETDLANNFANVQPRQRRNGHLFLPVQSRPAPSLALVRVSIA